MDKVKRPTRIVLGGIPIVVEWGDEIIEKEGEGEDLAPGDMCYGFSIMRNRRIAMRDSLIRSVERQTLLHELTHFIVEEFLESRPAEGQVDQMARGFLHLMRDNPALRRYLWGA